MSGSSSISFAVSRSTLRMFRKWSIAAASAVTLTPMGISFSDDRGLSSMRAGVGVTTAEGRSVAGGLGDVGQGVEAKRLFLAIADR